MAQQQQQQRGGRGRASVDLKLSILSALNKLADRDTQQIGVDELLKTSENLQPEGIPVLLGCLCEISPDQKSVVRREGVKLISILASLYGDLLTPHLQKTVAAIVRRLKETDSNIRDACVEAVGTLVAHVPSPPSLANISSGNADQIALSGPLGVFTKPLFDALNEQARNVQIGAAMCLARALDSAREPLPPPCVQRLCVKLLKFINSTHFNAKAALLPSFGGLARASGPGILQHLGLIIPCLQESLQSSDWATRKAAADTFGAVALSVGGPPLMCYKTATMALLEQYRFDKVKPTRDSVVDAFHIWKNVPDPPEETSSNKSSNSNGSVISKKQESRLSSPAPATPISKLHAPSDKGSVRKKPSSVPPERKTNLDFFKKLSVRNSDDWHVEVAVPRGSPPASHNKENREEVAAAALDAKLANAGLSNGHIADERERGLAVEREAEVVPDIEKNRAKTPRASGRFSENSQQLHQRQEDGFDPHNEPPKKSVPSTELIAIGRQLSTLEKGQSNLLEMLQEFMGNSQESTVSLESRVQRLERAMEDMARITAASMQPKQGRSNSLAKDVEDHHHPSELRRGSMDSSSLASNKQIQDAGSRRQPEPWSSDMLRGVRTSLKQIPRGEAVTTSEYGSETPSRRAWEQQQQQQRSLANGNQARLDEGPSARSVWRASKDEATLAAIRVAGSEEGVKGPSSAGSQEAVSTPFKEQVTGLNSGSWSIWSRVLDSLHAGDLDAAYEEVICTGDELLMVRLMNRTGPVLGQLSTETVSELVHAVALFLQQPSFVDCALPWIRQITDMVRTKGPNSLGLAGDVKRELVSALHEASMLDFPERWMGSAVSKMANQLAGAWLLKQQQQQPPPGQQQLLL